MEREILSTHQKALQINLDPSKYGTFAEIGAGQEVARWFFRVGGAAGTIAKTISAYDMIISDAIYGHADRYVSRQRLETMLDHEYALLLERLKEKRGATTRNFLFLPTRWWRAVIRGRTTLMAGWDFVSKPNRGRSRPKSSCMSGCGTKRIWPNRKRWALSASTLVHGAMYLHDDPAR
jgi:hypothetical protein